MHRIKPDWLPLYHRKTYDDATATWLPGCQRVAMYSIRRIAPGEEVTPEDHRLVDGSVPGSFDPVACGACGWTPTRHRPTFGHTDGHEFSTKGPG
jgi:hypothetical protein